MNRVFLTGRWSQDITLRYTPNGKAVASSSIAVDDGFGDNKKTYFLEVVIWGKTAEAVANYSGKGKKILIEGRLTKRSWEKDGQKRYATEVVADQVEFLEVRNQQDAEETGSRHTNNDPFKDDGKPIDINDDDLPF